MVVMLAAGSMAIFAGSSTAGAVLPDPPVHVPVDPDALELDPLPGGGVEGYVLPTGSQNWRVKTFAQVGDRIFVGGSFTTVTDRPWAGAATYDQPFLAAFDLYTNDYIDTFTPDFDDVVWALEVHDGNLIVGGEFNNVNGVARQGLVALDPETGATVGSFGASVDNAGSSYEATVRDRKRI